MKSNDVAFPPPLFLNFDAGYWWLQEDKADEKLRFYSQRSLLREAQLVFELLQNLPPTKSLLLVSPFVDELQYQIDALVAGQKKFIWFSPFSQTLNKEPMATKDSCCHLIQNQDQWQEFLYNLQGSEKFEIFVHPMLNKVTSFSYSDWILRQIKQGALRLKTIFHFEKIWQKNFSQNLTFWLETKDVSLLPPPDAILLAGPGAQDFFSQKEHWKKKSIWAADTCAGLCLKHGIIPQVIFSIDGGYASYEHFFFSSFAQNYGETFLVMDLLSLPAIVKKNFKQRFSYQSQYPPWQKMQHEKKFSLPLSEIKNSSGNVGGLMLEIGKTFFSTIPYKVFGYNQGHVHFDTHVRGSAYHQKQYRQMNRLQTCEQYFYNLSRHYYPQVK